jgi:uncharacterized protein (DUF2141 family)
MKTALILFMLMLASISQQNSATLTVKVTGFKSEKGVVRALLFNSENGFPEATEKAIRSASVKIVGTQAEFDFENLPPGRYAISLFHDSQNTGKLRTNLVGIPRDGYGFSNNSMGTFGPPSFKDASFQITAGQNTHIIKLRH